MKVTLNDPDGEDETVEVLQVIINLNNAQTDDAFQNIAQINDAMERILINDETKKRYLQLTTNVLITIQSRQSQSNDHPKTNLDVASHRKVDGNIQHLPEISDTVLHRKIVDPGFFG